MFPECSFAASGRHDGPHPPIGNREAIEQERPIDHFVIIFWVSLYEMAGRHLIGPSENGYAAHGLSNFISHVSDALHNRHRGSSRDTFSVRPICTIHPQRTCENGRERGAGGSFRTHSGPDENQDEHGHWPQHEWEQHGVSQR